MIRVALLLILLLTRCAQPDTERLALNSGFGGTGHAPGCPVAQLLPGGSGFGGTGHTAACGFGGTGVIGTITDFGSIWVNGLEIKLAPDLKIASNLGHPVKLAVGQQVVTRTQPGALQTDHVEVFYPVSGQVQQRNGNRLVVNGQLITLDAHTRGLKPLQPGDWVAVNGWPQGTHHWLATRIDPNPTHVARVEKPALDTLNSNRALIEGGVVIKDGNAWLEPYHLKLGNAADWRDRRLALATLKQQRAGWHLTAVRALHTWQVDWRELVREQHEQMRHSPPDRPRLELEHAQETLQERTESLHAHHDTLQEGRDELLESKQEMKDQQSLMQSQQETLHETHDQIQQSQDTIKEQHEMMQEQHDMTREQND